MDLSKDVAVQPYNPDNANPADPLSYTTNVELKG
jgi:hypothetical protein